jgi:uncharacterized membrane protein
LSIAFFVGQITRADVPAATVIEASKVVSKPAIVFRDTRALGQKCAVRLCPHGDHSLKDIIRGKTAALPAGDYLVTAWIEPVPVATQNGLAVHLTAGNASRVVGAAHFNPSGYTPITFHLLHTGGPIPFAIAASTDVLLNGIRPGQSDDEKTYATAKPKIKDLDIRKPDNNVDNLDIEETKDIATLQFDDVRIACDRIEFKPVRLSDVLVTSVDVDKVHYTPGETVNATCTVETVSNGSAGPLKLVAQLINEVDHSRVVFEHDLRADAGKPQTFTFGFKLDAATEFGHELRCVILRSGQPVHSNNQVFGVSKNVYRVGITGSAGPQDRSHLTEEDADKIALGNKASYANYFECFAWAPCDYCNMTPKTESFFSGQTQYHGSISGFKNMINFAHKYGIKAITYGKEAACSIDGANMYMKHPGWFGGGAPDFDTFYLERMWYDEYLIDDGEGNIVKWQSWPNWWVNDAVPDAVNFGADEIIRSAKMLGWDGVRWDGHYVNHMIPFNQRLNAALPNFIHGYNVAFANPGTPLFLPTAPASDFHEIARNHGMIMDESIREWSAGYGGAAIRPYYEAICREADYEKRIGGLPLFITFDRATHQDAIYNTLWGLAGGQRYTYNNTVGDFNAGPLTRFLTRYSAFIWDDTASVKDPARFVHVTLSAEETAKAPAEHADTLKPAAKPAVSMPPPPWFDYSTWLRKLPDGRQQLLINLVNPPNYPLFCNRVQTPPKTLHNLGIKVQLPAGAKLVRAFNVSIDNPDGLSALDATVAADGASVILPTLRFWSIVAFELESANDKPLAYPGYELTTPVEDAAKVLADQEKQKAVAAEQEAKAIASGVKTKPKDEGTHWYADYAHPKNVDLDYEKKLAKPANLMMLRNGVLDVVHVKGIYAWLSPFDNAVGLAGGGNLRSAYANHAGWRVGPEGCIEGFPETYKDLLAQDVIVLDNTLSIDLGGRHRVMLADFVRNGGGLVVMSGCNSVSCGTDHNSYIGDMLPVTIKGRRNTLNDNKGMTFAAGKNDVFSTSIEWSKIQAFTVDTSPLKEGVQILAKVGDHPAIVSWNYGKGRVICFLVNTEGDYGAGAKPYWLSAQWTQILADAVKWAAGDFQTVAKIVVARHVVDPTKAIPMDLLLNGEGLNADVFTKQLLEARDNVDDAASASTLIQAATEHWGKLADKDLLVQIVDDMDPYIDESFAPLAEKITALQLDDFRVAGFALLRHCSSPRTRSLLENALREKNPLIVREALAALAHAKDPASIPAIRQYLTSGGKEHLLALTALRLMGDEVDMEASLKEYVIGFRRVTALMAYRKSLFEKLHGGTSFKLTISERKNAEREFARSKITEKNAIFDITQFRSALTKFSDAQADRFIKFVAESDNRAAGSIAFAALPHFTPAQSAKFHQAMARAKLPQLQLLAGG